MPVSYSLSAANVEPVSNFLKGKRREKFLAAVAVLEAATQRGSWAGRERQKAESGFYQGLVSKPPTMSWGAQAIERDALHTADMCLMYGKTHNGQIPRVANVPQDVVEAWFKLCWERCEVTKQLDAARPRPVVTAVGLSPKVTKTLTEMNLDIDLPTIAPAEIEAYKMQARREGFFELLFNNDGSPKMEIHYRVKWAPDTKLGMSRFNHGCQACGKPIPSGMYVPIQAHCRKNGLLGLWIGCDCARNIFGVKDQGIKQE